MTDILAEQIGAPPGSHIAALRAQRPEILAHSQGYHDVLLSPSDPGGLSPAERALVAWRIAVLSRHDGLTRHYRSLLDSRDPALADAPRSGRPAAILAHAERVDTAPAQAEAAHIDALRAQGLSPRDIVALTQIVAFVAYQTRAAFGLALLVRSTAA